MKHLKFFESYISDDDDTVDIEDVFQDLIDEYGLEKVDKHSHTNGNCFGIWKNTPEESNEIYGDRFPNPDNLPTISVFIQCTMDLNMDVKMDEAISRLTRIGYNVEYLSKGEKSATDSRNRTYILYIR